MSERKKQKELKQPDALQRAGLEATSWIEGKEKYVVGLVVAVLVVFGGIAVADYFKDRRQRQAQQELGAALEPVTRPVSEGTTPPDTSGDEKPFASQQEKDQAIIDSLTKFRAAHEGTRSAATAALPLAEAYYREGKYDEAAKAFEEFLNRSPKDDPLRAVALEGQGYAYEAKGDLDKAYASYDALSKLETQQFLDGMGQFHKARVLILQGKKEEAAKALAEIPGQFPNSAAARMATERMNLLASQGVKVPAPVPPKSATDAGIAQGS
ncbi:MAG: tetratricopeptide repeat protein [Myxococcaceae bacterium]|nr:tetratricopeptide repeat protein [Myxococcaceae bacterium]